MSESGINIGYQGISFANFMRGAGRRSSTEEVVSQELSDLSTSKNGALFESVARVERQVDAIVGRGVRDYLPGIKQNVLQSVRDWTAGCCGQLFALYGLMGTGKSFFAANVYNAYKNDPSFDTVIFSSQQLYKETTDITNMLLVTASRLARTDSAFAPYFRDNALATDDISLLTEQVLFSPFEDKVLKKKVLIIIDGLDEFPPEDCRTFLNAVSHGSARLHREVYILFTSRPETYIRTCLHVQPRATYNIAQNIAKSHEDCCSFIRSKSAALHVTLDDSAQEELIRRSEYSLKYLEYFFMEAAQSGGTVTADQISDLPFGLLDLYRSQLERYFPENRLEFYQKELKPLLEILCAAYRPLSIDEAADVLSCTAADINHIILQAGTLLRKEDKLIHLFQAESFKQFLADETCCPLEYLVYPENGHKRLKSRSQSGLAGNSYLSTYATEHTLSSSSASDDDPEDEWISLVRLIANHVTEFDFVVNQCRILLEKPEEIVLNFLQALFADKTVSPVTREFITLRLIGASVSYHREEKYRRVLDRLPEEKQFTILTLYAKLRYARIERQLDEMKELIELWSEIASDASVIPFTRANFADEESRVATLRGDLVTAVQKLTETVQNFVLTQEDAATTETDRLLLRRAFSVAYDQMSRCARRLDTKRYADHLLPVYQELARYAEFDLPESIPAHCALLLSEKLMLKSLEYGEAAYEMDKNSLRRLYDLTYPLLELGKLYQEDAFPERDTARSIDMLERCVQVGVQLSLPKEISEEENKYERIFARAGISASNLLMKLYIDAKRFEDAERLAKQQQEHRARVAAYYDDLTTAYDTCYWQEMIGEFIEGRDGFTAAVSEYLRAAEMYSEGAARWKGETFIKAPAIVYGRIARGYRTLRQYAEQCAYLVREQEVRQAAELEGQAAERNEWFLYASYERLGQAYKDRGEEFYAQALELYERAEKGYTSLAERFPDNDVYLTANDTVYGQILNIYHAQKRYADANALIARITPIFDKLLEDHPSERVELTRNYIYECAANAIAVQRGSAAAADAYMQLIEAHLEGAKRWDSSTFRQKAEQRCADTARQLLNINKWMEAIRFLRLEQKLRNEDEANGTMPSNHVSLKMLMTERLSKALYRLGRPTDKAEALELCDTALAEHLSAAQKDAHLQTQGTLLALYERKAKLLLDLKRVDEAFTAADEWEKVLLSANQIRSEHLASYMRQLITFRSNLLLKQKSFDEAFDYLKARLAESEAQMVPDNEEDRLSYADRREFTRFLYLSTGDLILHSAFNERTMLQAEEYYLLAKSL